MNTPPIRVLLVDDHPSMLWGLERLIQSAGSTMQVVGKASNCADALIALDQTHAEVVLLDIDLGPESGLAAIPQLLGKAEVKILILTGMRDQAIHDKAMLAGARGVVLKEATPETILTAITCVYKGEIWLDRSSMGRLFEKLSHMASNPPVDHEAQKIATLTERELNIVAMSALHLSLSVKQIATKLFISEYTLRNHLASIYRKLNVSSRLELLVLAQKHGLDKVE
jgi:two-component system nitrate/nitrite response regulator NarL